MFEPGEKVVCINDSVDAKTRALFTAWPKQGSTYTIRECDLGRSGFNTSPLDEQAKTDYRVLLVELDNPLDPRTVNSKTGPQELGFSASRFTPLEHLNTKDSAKKGQFVPNELVPA